MPVPYKIGKPFVVRQFSLNYKHVFSMEYLYKRLNAWLVEEGYDGMTPGGLKGENWKEHLYLERMLAPGVKQMWIWWRTQREHSSMVRSYLDVDYHVLGLTSHEVVVDGTKIKTNKGEVEVFVTAKMVIDPSKSWDSHFLLKNEYLRKFYLDRVYKKNLEGAEKRLVKDAARLLGAIKQYLQLESWMPEYSGKPFHPSKGEIDS